MRRRESGDGAIYQRKSDGKWTATLELGWENGKRLRKVLYGSTRKEVREKLEDAKKQQAQGAVLRTSKQTFDEFITHWLTTVQKTKVAPSTYAREESAVRCNLIPA